MATREVTVHLVIDDERIRKLVADAVDAASVDEHCWLGGYEDGGVGVNCRTCDLGGQPVAYYPGTGDNPYPEAETPTVTGIFDLYVLANKHVREHHRPA
jgi:hypothetical protein